MDIRERLGAEFEERWTRNGRYSLRAFARDLGMHHTTVSRVLDRRYRVTARMARLVGARLGLSERDLDAAGVTANAECLERCIGHTRFAPNCRQLAMLAGMSIDDVNVALHHLLYQRRLTMTTPREWQLQSA